MMKDKYCLGCGKLFTPHSNAQRICSKPCVDKRKNESRLKMLLKNPNTEIQSAKKYREKNSDKIKQKAKEKWLIKNNKTELSEKGKSANITREYNRKAKECVTVDCLLEEFGDLD